VGIGTASETAAALKVAQNQTTTSAYQYGVFADPTFGSAATGYGIAGFFRTRTAALSFTTAATYGIFIDGTIKGTGSTITTNYGLKIESQTAGATNYAIRTGTGTVSFGDNVGIGATSPHSKLHLAETASGAAGVDFPLTLSSDRYQADYGVGIAFRPENQSTDYKVKTAIIASGGGYGYNQADLHFCLDSDNTITNEVGLSDARMTIKKSGNVGIGTTSPDSELEVEGSTGAIQIRVKGTVADGYRHGYELESTHTGGRTWSMFTTNDSDGAFGGGKLVFSSVAADSATAANSPLTIDSAGALTVTGELIHGGSTGVHEQYFSGVSIGNATFYHDITHNDDSGSGTVLHVQASFSHHPSYDCILDTWVSRRLTALTHYELLRRDTSTSGAWAVSYQSATVTRITKSAGTYAGSGPYWIKVTWRNN
jgi:hypothetical protein